MSGASREELDANLDRFGLGGTATVLERDIFDVLRDDTLGSSESASSTGNCCTSTSRSSTACTFSSVISPPARS